VASRRESETSRFRGNQKYPFEYVTHTHSLSHDIILLCLNYILLFLRDRNMFFTTLIL
jgi:hypothetical protein